MKQLVGLAERARPPVQTSGAAQALERAAQGAVGAGPDKGGKDSAGPSEICAALAEHYPGVAPVGIQGKKGLTTVFVHVSNAAAAPPPPPPPPPPQLTPPPVPAADTTGAGPAHASIAAERLGTFNDKQSQSTERKTGDGRGPGDHSREASAVETSPAGHGPEALAPPRSPSAPEDGRAPQPAAPQSSRGSLRADERSVSMDGPPGAADGKPRAGDPMRLKGVKSARPVRTCACARHAALRCCPCRRGLLPSAARASAAFDVIAPLIALH
jgi:hypothetical protein